MLKKLIAYVERMICNKPSENEETHEYILQCFTDRKIEHSVSYLQHTRFVGHLTLNQGVENTKPETIPVLIHTISVPEDFHYCALTSPTRQSARWRKTLQRHCCNRTAVRWYYQPEKKQVFVEGWLKSTKSPKRVMKHMDCAVDTLVNWISILVDAQGIPTLKWPDSLEAQKKANKPRKSSPLSSN